MSEWQHGRAGRADGSINIFYSGPILGHPWQGRVVRHPTVAAAPALVSPTSSGAAITAGTALLTALHAITAALRTGPSPAVAARAHQCATLL